MKKRAIYEQFHKKTKLQSRIITKDNFTYRTVLGVLEDYISSEMQILDLGCGVGALSFYMAAQGNKVTGIDISEKAVDACQKSIKYLNLPIKPTFLAGDFMKIRRKTKFDLVLCSEVIEHLENDRRALDKIYAHLKPNGILILSTPSKKAPLYRWGLAKSFDKKVGHLRRYRLDDLVTFCRNIGFRILETRKAEGVFRNSLFLFRFGDLPLRLANRFRVFSDIITFFDNVLLKLFGESQVFVIAQKS